jgi:uncharacterized protein (TIGR02453 family)
VGEEGSVTISSEFTGFPAEALDFYVGLETDNSKAYWHEHKAVYEEAVRAPMEALLGSLPGGYPPFKVMRPYRDLRFSRDKSPYKTACGASSWSDRGAGYYLQLSGEGFLAGAGMYELGRDQLERFRNAVADDDSGAEFEALVQRSRAGKLDVGPGMEQSLKTAPRGYPKDHPRIDLLRWKGCVTMAETKNRRLISSGRLRDWVLERFELSGLLTAWLEQHVGPTTEDRSRP